MINLSGDQKTKENFKLLKQVNDSTLRKDESKDCK